jgi:hypothetical protein
LRSIPEQSMRVQIRYEVVEDVGDLVDRYKAGQKSERDEAIELDRLRVQRWITKEAEGHYMRPILHAYLIWDPVLHRRLAGKPLRPKGELFSLSARRSIERSRQEHQDKQRVLKGGHDVPEAIVRRRFDRSLRNFFVEYRELAHSWYLFDNTSTRPATIAFKTGDRIRIMNQQEYKTLITRYGEK